MEKFDPKLNRDQLQQCLLKLVKMDAVIVPTLDLEIPLEEFESYFLLANLGLCSFWSLGPVFALTAYLYDFSFHRQYRGRHAHSGAPKGNQVHRYI